MTRFGRDKRGVFKPKVSTTSELFSTTSELIPGKVR
jgi:hypothetical protein